MVNECMGQTCAKQPVNIHVNTIRHRRVMAVEAAMLDYIMFFNVMLLL